MQYLSRFKFTARHVRSIASPIALLLASTAVHANGQSSFENLSYSYFGLGLDTLVYREQLDNFFGSTMKTDFRTTASVQRSGGYTSVNEDWGFTIRTLSTLFSEDESEDWNLSGVGTIQRNKMALNRQEINLLAHRHLRTGYHLFSGLNYSKVAFNRHHFRSAEGTDAFRAGKLAPDQTFDPESIAGSVSEEQVTIKLQAGLGYDSYFMDTREGLRFQYEASVGLPVYRRVINALEDAVLTELFSKGISFNAAVGVGWQFSRHLSVNYRVEALYSYLEKLEEGALTVPETYMYGIANFASVNWNF